MRKCCLYLLCLLLACPASAAMQQESAVAQARMQAETLLESGQNQSAYELYMRLLREDPTDPTINMGLFKAASAIGSNSQAILALERLLDVYPHDAGLRMELVRLHLMAGEPQAAQQEMELAKAFDSALSDELAASVLTRLEKETARWQFSGRFSAGVLYDTNVNMGPQSAFMQLGLWNLQIDSAATEKRSWGGYAATSLDGGWRMGPQSSWWVVGDISLYRKGYFSDLPSSRELAWGRTALGLRHLGRTTFFDLRLKTDVTDYISEDQAAYGNGAELLFIYAPIPKLQFLSRAGLDRRDYKETTGRQGWYGWGGEYVRWLFEGGHDITFGGRWLFADTANRNYGWNGWELALNSTIKLPGDVDLLPLFNYRKERYRGPATALEFTDRKDENLRAGLGLSWAFTPALSLDVLYQYTNNNSTSPLYDYDQHLVNVGMTWKF